MGIVLGHHRRTPMAAAGCQCAGCQVLGLQGSPAAVGAVCTQGQRRGWGCPRRGDPQCQGLERRPPLRRGRHCRRAACRATTRRARRLGQPHPLRQARRCCQPRRLASTRGTFPQGRNREEIMAMAELVPVQCGKVGRATAPRPHLLRRRRGRHRILAPGGKRRISTWSKKSAGCKASSEVRARRRVTWRARPRACVNRSRPSRPGGASVRQS
mmetsp:Transcript_87530/g.245867  ORF Transcript_87530/g.245867 Transcript_87530/m.245867 type:complete len:213 (-) Transcript_87530:1301-1939(-)